MGGVPHGRIIYVQTTIRHKKTFFGGYPVGGYPVRGGVPRVGVISAQTTIRHKQKNLGGYPMGGYPGGGYPVGV